MLLKNERGKLFQCPAADYYSRPELNPSSICAGLIGKSEVDVAAIRHALTEPDSESAQASQDRMDRGTLVHMALLQPERLATDVAVWGGKLRKGAEWDAFEDQHKGSLILRRCDYLAAMAAANAVTRHKAVCELLEGCQAEVCMLTRWLGVEVRGMVDAVNLERRVIVDIKTTEAGIGQDQVERTIRNFCYREKMACYRAWIAHVTGTDANDWRCFNLFINMAAPYGIRKVKFTTMALEWGQVRVDSAVQQYKQALNANQWTMFYADDVVDVKPWEIENEEDSDVEW